MNVLILGGGGQVGLELQACPWPAGVRLHAPPRSAVDVGDEHQLADVVESMPWSAIINAAAYTAVDKAEGDIAEAWRLNAVFPARLAQLTAARRIPLIHVSTDYVFDGTTGGAYPPDAPVAPASVYGASKAAGELAVAAGNPRHVIVRTAWVVSPHRSNFVKTMLRLAGERDSLRVVNDQTGCPTSARDLAGALAVIAARHMADPAAPCGTFHCVNAGATTWFGLAEAIMAGAAARGGRHVPVEPIVTSAYPTPARRPANSQLCTKTLTAAFGLKPRHWEAALEDILNALIGAPTHNKEVQL